MNKRTLLCLLLSGILCNTVLADDADSPDAPDSQNIQEFEEVVPETESNGDKFDATHKFVVHHADNIAEWVDSFFGDQETEEEAPYSTIRLRIEHEWDEDLGNDVNVGLRGKIHLPKLDKRLSLLFSDSENDTSADEIATQRREDSDDVQLQYNVREVEHHRIDIRGGLRSNGNLKASIKYRYKQPLGEQLEMRFSEELRYRGGDGIGARTRLQFDKTLHEDKVIRWVNRVNWEEEESGVEWSSVMSLDRRIDESRAFSYYFSLDGNTQPVGRIENYGIGIRYRQSFHKPWLFYEVQPYYQFRKDIDRDSREGVPGIIFQIIAVFEKEAK